MDRKVQLGSTAAPAQYSITIEEGGPLVVKGKPALVQQIIETDKHGTSVNYQEGKKLDSVDSMRLCRCGHTENAPFCDGHHQRVPVDLDETASFEPALSRAEMIPGPDLVLADTENLCAFARFCDANERVWNEVSAGTTESNELVVEISHHCPGGRLLAISRETGLPVEEVLEPQLNLVEDPKTGSSGPIMVIGGIPVISSDGNTYEVRNRQALCRCGQSQNKPFCDGTHASVRYQDHLR